MHFASILILLFYCATLTKLTGRQVKYTDVVRHDEFAFAKVPPYSKFEFGSRGIHFAGSAPGLSQIYGNFLSRERAAYSEGRPSNINSNQSLFSHTTNLEELRSWFSDGSYYLLPTLLLPSPRTKYLSVLPVTTPLMKICDRTNHYVRISTHFVSCIFPVHLKNELLWILLYITNSGHSKYITSRYLQTI